MSDAVRWSDRFRRWSLLAAPFVIPFIALLVVSAPQGLSSLVTVYQIPILTTAEDAVITFGGSDAGSMLTAALSWNDIHAVTPGLHWVYTFWPPGMVVVDGLLVALQWSTGIPVVLSMVVVNCAVWAVFFGVCFRVIRSVGGLPPAVSFAVAAFVSTAVTAWGTSAGLFYSDSFGAIAYCFSILLTVHAVRAETLRSRLRRAALAGLFLGAAAYFRAPFELVALASLATCVVVLAVAFLIGRFQPHSRFVVWARTAVLPLGVLSLVAEAFLLPWRIYLGWRIHPGDFRWSAVSDLASVARWLPTQMLLDNGIGFGVTGHSNWACINDLEQCENVYALEQSTPAPYSAGPDGYFTGPEFDKLTLDSFLGHPFTYIAERFRALVIGFASNDGQGVKNYAFPETILMSIVVVLLLIVLVRRKALFSLPSLLFVGGALVQVATLTLMHQESRYWLAIELSIIVFGALVLGSARRPGRLFGVPLEVVRGAPAAQPRENRPDAVAPHGQKKAKASTAKLAERDTHD